MERLIKLAIADSYKIFRDGIRMAMKTRDGIRILWEAEDAKDMRLKLKLKIPDVLLMDAGMGGANGLKNIQTIKKEFGDVKLIVISMCDDMETIAQIMEYGANAYLTKTADADEIYKAIIVCTKDDFYFNDQVNEVVRIKLQQNKTVKKFYPLPAKFNDKELKILKLISDDKTTEEISDEVFLSPRTVETIRQNMKTKVGAKTIAGLLMYAIRNKLVEIF